MLHNSYYSPNISKKIKLKKKEEIRGACWMYGGDAQ